MPADDSPRVLLVLASDFDAPSLEVLEDEAEAIRAALAAGEAVKVYDVRVGRASSAAELAAVIADARPDIVHFTARTMIDGEPSASAGRAAVDAFLAGTPDGPRLAVFLGHGPAAIDRPMGTVSVAIAVPEEIGDGLALAFAVAFYSALGQGEEAGPAFRIACGAIDINSLPDLVVPRLLTAPRVPGEDVEEADVSTRGIETGTTRDLSPDPTLPRLYTLWYGTNRAPLDRANPTAGFGPEDDQRLHHGSCQVSIPKAHKIGEIGSSLWDRWMMGADDRLKLDALTLMAADAFWSAVRGTLAKWGEGSRSAVVFIHGFNVSFEDAAIRAAQVGFDLQVPGVMAFYSWPSKAKVAGYTADEATIEATEPFLTEFLTRFATESGAERVHVIAHSMGNRGLLRSVQRIVADTSLAGKVRFDNIILAAPDVDRRLFMDLARHYTQVARRTTLYTSSKDKALLSSGIVHDLARAGYRLPMTLVDKVDTVDVSNVDLSFLGHGYFAAARDLLRDIQSMLVNDMPADRRVGLVPSKTPDGGGYWTIGA